MNRFASIALALCVLASGAGWTALDYAQVAGVKRQGGAAAFSPLSVSNCVYWFDGADSNTVTLTNNLVTAWRSKGSNTNAATAPTYPSAYSNDAVSGRSALWFNGTSAMRGYNLPAEINLPTNGTGGPYTFIAGYTRPTPSSYSLLWSSSESGKFAQPGAQWTDGRLFFQMLGYGRITTNNYGTGRKILTYYSDGSALGGDYNIRHNGSSVTDFGAPYVAASGKLNAIGYYAGGTIIYHNGWIFEMIYYNRKLTISEIQQIEEYLRAKWSAY